MTILRGCLVSEEAGARSTCPVMRFSDATAWDGPLNKRRGDTDDLR